MMAVDAYLEDQHDLLARLARLDVVTAQLAHTAPVAPMSSQIKTKLMAQVRAEGASAAVRLSVAAPATSSSGNPLFGGRKQGRPGQSQPPSSRPIQPPLPAQLSTRRFNFGWLAAAAIAAAALFIVWVDIGAQRQIVQLQAQLAARESELIQIQQQLPFFISPSQIVSLDSTGESVASGIFYQHNERALLVLHDLPPLPETQTYQLWLIPADGAPKDAGLLTVQSADESHQQVELPTDALAYNAIGISIEPAGGSETPTVDQIVLFGQKT
jgi:Anti-sigma-K factor rskA